MHCQCQCDGAHCSFIGNRLIFILCYLDHRCCLIVCLWFSPQSPVLLTFEEDDVEATELLVSQVSRFQKSGRHKVLIESVCHLFIWRAFLQTVLCCLFQCFLFAVVLFWKIFCLSFASVLFLLRLLKKIR